MIKELVLNNIRTDSWSLPLLAPYFLEAAKKKVRLSDIENCDLIAKVFSHNIQYHISDSVVTELSGDDKSNYLRLISKSGSFAKFDETELVQLKDLLKFSEIDSKVCKILSDQLIFSGFLRLNEVNFKTASHPHFYGIIILSELFFKQSIESKYISVCHELGHHELFLINTTDRLVVNEYENHKVFVQLQNTERPPMARLHSLFALDKMISAAKRIRSLELEKFETMIIQNLETFNEIELTEFGNKVVTVLKEKHGM